MVKDAKIGPPVFEMLICHAKTEGTKDGRQLLAFNHRRGRVMTAYA